jgi:electron transport complex protein RnfG
MAKLESNFKNMVVVLTSTALITAFLLAFVYNLTAEPIKKAQEAKLQNAIIEVLPTFDRYETSEVNSLTVYKAYKNNKYVGTAVAAFSPDGFNGNIDILVGFDTKGNIFNYVVLEQKETPGLGTKIVDWFKTDKNNQSIINKNPSKNNIKLKKDGGEIDGITASTITSRAFVQAIERAYNAYSNNADVITSATEKTNDALSGATSGSNISTTDSTIVEKTIKEEFVKPAVVNPVVPTIIKDTIEEHKDTISETENIDTIEIEATTGATTSNQNTDTIESVPVEETVEIVIIEEEKEYDNTISKEDNKRQRRRKK